MAASTINENSKKHVVPLKLKMEAFHSKSLKSIFVVVISISISIRKGIQGVVGVSNQPLNLVDLFWQI